MKIFAFLIILSVHMSTASKKSIEQKISIVKDFMKKIKENPNFGICLNKGASTYKIQLSIPLGAQRCYGAQKDPETARKAIAMIVQAYLNSLERVRDGTLKSEATFKLLKLRYNDMFPIQEKDLISKIEDTMKNIEENQNFGVRKSYHRYIVEAAIPYGKKHWYGSHYNHATARKAVLMIAQEYKKSLEAKSPATLEDLQKKYDAMFSKSKDHVLSLVSKFEVHLKKIEQNPNFGIYLNGRKCYVNIWIPLGKRHLYGAHNDKETARSAVLMIANEYMKSLRLMENGELESALTFHQLKLKYDAMFGELQKRICPNSDSNYEECKLDIENANDNLRMIFRNTVTPQKSNQTDENGISHGNFKLNENLFKDCREPSKKQSKNKGREKFQRTESQQTIVAEQTSRKSTNEQNDAAVPEETDDSENRFNKAYKIRRIWNIAEDEPKHGFFLYGCFKVMNHSDVLWVNAIKKVDGRLSGYYEEYDSRGWVNLEYVKSTDFEGPKEMNENLKRKREESEIFSKESESGVSTRGNSNN